jgi:galactonate dehydratase
VARLAFRSGRRCQASERRPSVRHGRRNRLSRTATQRDVQAADSFTRGAQALLRRRSSLIRKVYLLFSETLTEPLLPTQPEEIADLAKYTSIPIALGERLFTRADFRPYFEKGAISIAQPDVSHCGGISELRRIAAAAETYDVALAPHCPLGPLALAACMQVALTAPNCELPDNAIPSSMTKTVSHS